MTFILIPTAGPARAVRQRPTLSSFSDAIGGAVPVLAGGPDGVGFVARETFVEEGLDRNAVASTLATLSTARLMPFGGPVVMCSLATGTDTLTGKIVGYRAVDMSEDTLAAFLVVAEDLRAVQESRPRDISGKASSVADWYNHVRTIMDKVVTAPYPPGWPHPGGEDEVARLFAKIGISVHPKVDG